MVVKLPQLSFYDSAACRSRHYCRPCRARANKRFRPGWAANHATRGGVDFECVPLGLKFDDEPGGADQEYPAPLSNADLDRLMGNPPPIVATADRPKWEQRERPTIAMAAAWAMAAAAGKYAPAADVAERDAICNACEMAREDEKGKYCSICKCGIYSDEKAIKNLAAYVENMPTVPGYNKALPVWGCKHPQRGAPKDPKNPTGPKCGWPLPVVK